MSIHVFNNFNNCFLAGQVPATMDVRFIPVNSNFTSVTDDENFYKLRNLSDLSEFAKVTNRSTAVWTDQYLNDDYSLSGIYYDYTCRKVETTESVDKPDFINAENFDSFVAANTITDRSVIERLKGYSIAGFYYVKTREGLLWVADRVNDKDRYNNFINIVLGDDVGDAAADEPFSLPIIGSHDRPYQGTFDGMGHKMVNVTLMANKLANGLIGYLGDLGKLCNLQLGDANSTTVVVCRKKISLPHLKSSAANINTGVLVGENYGTVSNVAVFGKFRFKDFTPSVYPTTNKTENNSSLYEKDPYDTDTPYSNTFFNDAFCWNSPFNIVPYMGYFAQGIPYSTTFTYGDDKQYSVFSAEYGIQKFGVYSAPNTTTFSVDYYGNIQEADSRARDNCDGSFRSNTNHDKGDNDCAYFFDAYLNVPSKLQHSLRCAYYCSPTIGCNNGNIDHVYVSATVEADDSVFVGFIGGICGLQNRGYSKACVSDLFFNGRNKDRSTTKAISARTLDYSVGDLSASKLSYVADDDNDGTFELYYRSESETTHRKFPGVLAVYADGESTAKKIVPATAWFPAYDDKDNCARKPASKANIELFPCQYDDDESVSFTANSKRYQLYYCTINGVQLDFGDHDNGNFKIQFGTDDAMTCYPFSAKPNSMSHQITPNTTQTASVYARCDITTDANGYPILVDGATEIAYNTAYDASFTAKWTDGVKYARMLDSGNNSDGIVSRKGEFNREIIANISNFKIGVLYGKTFTDCSNSDIYIYNDYGINNVRFSTDDAVNEDIAKDLYEKYPTGISFEDIPSDDLGMSFTTYSVKTVTGTASARKEIDTIQVELADGTTIEVAKNYYQSTREEVKNAINTTLDAWYQDGLSAILFGTQDVHDNASRNTNEKYATLVSLKLQDQTSLDDTVTIKKAHLKMRGLNKLGSTDQNIYTTSHFEDFSTYTSADKGYTVADVGNKAAVIYSCRNGDDQSKAFTAKDAKVYDRNYFAVKEVEEGNMTAVAGVPMIFSAVKYVEKSIYNVGGYAGMLTPSDGFTIEDTSAAYSCDSNNYRETSDTYPNIGHYCRYGGLAAKAEIQTCNISNTIDMVDNAYPNDDENKFFSHVVSAKNCSFYNNYVPDDRAADVISNAVIAEINYLRLPIPSIYQFENGKDKDCKGKNYKIGIWTSDVPYHQHPVTINLWNNSVGSAAWPYVTSDDSNPHGSVQQFAAEHTAVNKLFRFENCSVGLSNLNTNADDIASAYIASLNAINSFSNVYNTHGDREDKMQWCRNSKYFKCNTKVMSTHDYMAGDMILVTADLNDRSITKLEYPTKHFSRISYNSNSTASNITTAVNFAENNNFKLITSKQIPNSASIVSISPLSLTDSYFTYTYDVSAREGADNWIQIDEPVKKLCYGKNFEVTDLESDLIAIQSLITDAFSMLVEGYKDGETTDNTTIMQSSITSVNLTCGEDTASTKTFDRSSLLSLKDIANVVTAANFKLDLNWLDVTKTTTAPVKTESQKFLKESKLTEIDSLANSDLYMFKSLESKQKEGGATPELLFVIKNPEIELIKHGYLFEDALNTEDESKNLASEYFGNTIHIGTKYKPEYIRSEIINSTSNTFTYSGAAFKDLAGFLLVDTATKNLVSYIDAGDGEFELNNGCWSMKFDQATKSDNTDFPYNTSAVLINITTEE